MLFNTNKEKGIAGLSMAIAYYGSNGFGVSLPLNDTQPYDLVVDTGAELHRVQVRATGQLAPSGAYVVSMKSAGGTNGSVYARVSESNVTRLFVLCTNGDMYDIPRENFEHARSSLTLSGKIEENKVVF